MQRVAYMLQVGYAPGYVVISFLVKQIYEELEGNRTYISREITSLYMIATVKSCYKELETRVCITRV